MKHGGWIGRLNIGTSAFLLSLLIGCGAERTIEVTFHDETTPVAPPVTPAPRPVVTPQQVIPDSIHIEAQLSDVYLRAKPTNPNTFTTETRFTLSLAQFSGNFPEALDLANAESFQFRSKYNDGCDKNQFRFGSISPTEPSAHQFIVVESKNDADCNQLFGNLKKDMRVEFTNVPLVRDRKKVVAFVSLHMIP